MDRPARSQALAASLAFFCLAGCDWFQWRKADEFQETLRCGMTPEQVGELAAEMSVDSFRPIPEPHRYTTHVLNEGATFFEFYFGADGLETVRQGASVGLTTGTAYDPRVNLCTGEVSDDLALTLQGSAALAGGAIFVDGEPYGHLPRVPDYRLTIGLATGPHEIRIEKDGYEPIVIPVDYPIEVESSEIVLPDPDPETPN